MRRGAHGYPVRVRVLVHADDLGMSAAVDAAVVAALREGTVDAVSALAIGPSVREGVRALPEGVSLGLHLDYTGFPSLTGAAELDGVRAAAAAGQDARVPLGLVPEEVRFREAMAQWEALSVLRPVDHLDSHHHVHWAPDGWPLLERVLRATRIRVVRPVGAWRPEAGRAARAMQAARAWRFRRRFAAWIAVDGFCGATTFRRLLESGRAPRGDVEVMVHPGNPTYTRYDDELEWLRGDWGGRRAAVTRISRAEALLSRL